MRKNPILLWTITIFISGCSVGKVTTSDYKKDVLLQTNYGAMVLRLSDLTPQHRDNFIRLVKSGYYNGVLFHRVIKNFMIQAGDPDSRRARDGQPLGEGGPKYTVPAELNAQLFHQRGALGAAREGDDVNPGKASSGSQFYIVQGKIWTEEGLDTLETKRLNGLKLPEAHRKIYTTRGGAPHLDGNYTVFGQLVKGDDVLDKIAAVTTSKGNDKDRPVYNIRITKAKMIRRSE